MNRDFRIFIGGFILGALICGTAIWGNNIRLQHAADRRADIQKIRVALEEYAIKDPTWPTNEQSREGSATNESGSAIKQK